MIAAIVGLVAVSCVAVAALATLVAARAQAVAAADASALAAAVATYPPAGPGDTAAAVAADVARVNDAELLACICSTDHSLQMRTAAVLVEVVVRVPVFGEITVQAGSRAEFDPIRWLGP